MCQQWKSTFKKGEKRWNINTQRNYTNKSYFALGKPYKYSFSVSKLNDAHTTWMDVHSLCALLFTCSNVAL